MPTKEAPTENFADRTAATRNGVRSEDSEMKYLLDTFFAPAINKEFVGPHNSRSYLSLKASEKGFTKSPDSGQFSASFKWNDKKPSNNVFQGYEAIVEEHKWMLKALEAGIEVVKEKAESAGVNIDIRKEQVSQEPVLFHDDAGKTYNEITHIVTVDAAQPGLRGKLINGIVDDRMAAVTKKGYAFGEESLPALRAVLEQDLNRQLDNVAHKGKA